MTHTSHEKVTCSELTTFPKDEPEHNGQHKTYGRQPNPLAHETPLSCYRDVENNPRVGCSA